MFMVFQSFIEMRKHDSYAKQYSCPRDGNVLRNLCKSFQTFQIEDFEEGLLKAKAGKHKSVCLSVVSRKATLVYRMRLPVLVPKSKQTYQIAKILIMCLSNYLINLLM